MPALEEDTPPKQGQQAPATSAQAASPLLLPPAQMGAADPQGAAGVPSLPTSAPADCEMLEVSPEFPGRQLCL